MNDRQLFSHPGGFTWTETPVCFSPVYWRDCIPVIDLMGEVNEEMYQTKYVLHYLDLLVRSNGIRVPLCERKEYYTVSVGKSLSLA